MNKEANIRKLLKNFVESQKDIEIAYVYSDQGLLISKYGKLESNVDDENKIDEIYGALTALVENLLSKVCLEYQIGHYGSGSFETSDHRIIYLEAGDDAILFLVCDYKIDLNQLFPVAYLVVEKIAQLLEDSFDFAYNTLDIPNLKIDKKISINLDNFTVSNSDKVIDGAKTTHLIKKEKNVEKLFKLILLGPAAVGKTTLVNQFLKKEQIIDVRPTIGISISTQEYLIKGFKEDKIKFLIYDLAGQNFFRRVRSDYYKGANSAFIVYDVTRRKSFEEAINFWYKDAKKVLGEIPFVFIGNKIDLEENRDVQYEEGVKIAQEHNSSFIETSALRNINVQDTFKLVGIGLLFNYPEKTELEA